MKNNSLLAPALGAAFGAGCNQEKAAIEDTKEAAQKAIDHREEVVDAAAKEANGQTDINAMVDKANIGAARDSTRAQLDADKKKAEAEAKTAKAGLDAGKKRRLGPAPLLQATIVE